MKPSDDENIADRDLLGRLRVALRFWFAEGPDSARESVVGQQTRAMLRELDARLSSKDGSA